MQKSGFRVNIICFEILMISHHKERCNSRMCYWSKCFLVVISLFLRETFSHECRFLLFLTPLALYFYLKVHFNPIIFFSGEGETNFHVLFLIMILSVHQLFLSILFFPLNRSLPQCLSNL